VDEEYKSLRLVPTESPRLADPVSGNILEPPSVKNLTAPAVTPLRRPHYFRPDTASDISEAARPDSEWATTARPTDETRKIIAEALATPNPRRAGDRARSNKSQFTVTEDATTDE